MALEISGDDGVKQNPQTGSIHDEIIQETNEDRRATRAASKSGAPGMPKLLRQVLDVSADAPMSVEGSEYLKKLTESMEIRKIKLTRLPSTNAYVMSKNEQHIAIIFEEHHRPTEGKPSACTDNLMRVDTEFNRVFRETDGPLLDTIMITTDDYPYWEKMSNFISQSLDFGQTQDMSFAWWEECKFFLSTNLAEVHQSIKDMCPHGVYGRVDFGIVMKVLNEQEEYRDRPRFDRDRDLDYRTVGVIGGFTDFTEDTGRSREVRRQPIVHVTEIQSVVRSIRMLAPLLGFFVDYAFLYNGWLSPFENFTSKKGANLGNLFFDTDGQPEEITNSDQMRNLLATDLNSPALFIDIQYGRAMLPGLWMMADRMNQEPVMKDMAAFFGTTSILKNSPTLLGPSQSINTGVIVNDGVPVDSRTIDYFTVIKTISDRDQLNNFLYYDADPRARMEDITKVGYRNTRNLYETKMCPVDAVALGALLGEISGRIAAKTDYADGRNAGFGNSFAEHGRGMEEMLRNTSSIVRRSMGGGGYFRRSNAFRR